MRAALILPLLAVAAPLPAAPDAVDAFRCHATGRATNANVLNVYAAYGSRSVAIIRAALDRDATRLRGMVAPTATFTVFQGDVGVGPRSTGATAAMDFVRQIRPKRYQYSAGSAGPFSMDPCGETTTELTLRGSEPRSAVVATFKYKRGLLMEVQGSQVELVEGSLSPQSSRSSSAVH